MNVTIKVMLVVASFLAVFTAMSPAANATEALRSKLPVTDLLQKDLETSRAAISSTHSRLKRLQSSARDCRKAAENVSNMIKAIKAIEDQISRLESQLNSLSKVPQLKMLKPIATGLGQLKSKVAKVRVNADKVRKSVIDPSITKIKTFEKKVSAVAKKVQVAEVETIASQQQISSFKSYVTRNGFRRLEVLALEKFSGTVRKPLVPIRNVLKKIDNTGANAEGKLVSFKNSMNPVLALKSGVDKLKKKLEPIDKKARDLDKAMNKALTFKIPFTKKRVSVTVRKILEAPDKVLKIAVKPLTKLATKILSPLTKKIKFDIKAPKELQQIADKLESLKSKKLDLELASQRFQEAANAKAFVTYTNANARIKKMTTSRLR